MKKLLVLSLLLVMTAMFTSMAYTIDVDIGNDITLEQTDVITVDVVFGFEAVNVLQENVLLIISLEVVNLKYPTLETVNYDYNTMNQMLYGNLNMQYYDHVVSLHMFQPVANQQVLIDNRHSQIDLWELSSLSVGKYFNYTISWPSD